MAKSRLSTVLCTAFVLLGTPLLAQGPFTLAHHAPATALSLSNNRIGKVPGHATGGHRDAPPVNDDCSGAVAHALGMGETIQLSGNNTGATEDGNTGLVLVWEAFTTTECATITINYCVPGSEFTNHLRNLAVNCPNFLSGILLGVDGPCNVVFNQLAAGTYWIPVYVAAGITPAGPYTIAVSAAPCAAPTAYCIPLSAIGPNNGDFIRQVQLGSINNSSYFQTNITYVDYTAQNTDLAAGQTYHLAIMGSAFQSDKVAAWIDYNRDFIFSADEKIGEDSTVMHLDSTLLFTFTVPTGTAPGATRMRVRTADVQPGQPDPLLPCYNYSRCETEDYTVNIIHGSTTPVNDECGGAAVQPLAAGQTLLMGGDNTGATPDGTSGLTLVWEAFSLTTCSTVTIDYCQPGSIFSDFLVNLAVQCPDFASGLLSASSADTCSATFTDLPPGTYWIPVLADQDAPTGPYTIAVSAVAGCQSTDTYCIPTSAIGPDEGDYISNVHLGAIDNSSVYEQGTTYVDYTAQTTTLAPGQPYTISITAGTAQEDAIAVWIDYNGDHVFSADEKIGEALTTSANEVVTFTFTVPGGIMVASTRMRVRLVFPQQGEPAPMDPCYAYTWGETEDYTISFTSTGVAMPAAGGFAVFPNPGNGNIMVHNGGQGGDVLLQLTDMTGRTVFTDLRRMDAGTRTALNLGGQLAPGTYLLRMSTREGRFEQRVVVQ